MLSFLVFLFSMWLVAVILSFVIESLFWLAIVGSAFFVVLTTVAYAWVKREALRS